jgi:hypothetical protein
MGPVIAQTIMMTAATIKAAGEPVALVTWLDSLSNNPFNPPFFFVFLMTLST